MLHRLTNRYSEDAQDLATAVRCKSRAHSRCCFRLMRLLYLDPSHTGPSFVFALFSAFFFSASSSYAEMPFRRAEQNFNHMQQTARFRRLDLAAVKPVYNEQHDSVRFVRYTDKTTAPLRENSGFIEPHVDHRRLSPWPNKKCTSRALTRSARASPSATIGSLPFPPKFQHYTM